MNSLTPPPNAEALGLKLGCRPTMSWVRSLPEDKINLSKFHLLTPYERSCILFPAQWRRRIKVSRHWNTGDREICGYDQVYMIKHQSHIASASGPAPSLVNTEELASDLCRANGRRAKAGVLTLQKTMELGLAYFPAVNNEILVLFAPAMRFLRPVRQVTCAVLMKMPDEEKVLGYGTVLPKWHPLLAGEFCQGLEFDEVQCFFPDACRRWHDYWSAIRSQKLADDDDPTLQLETTGIDLI